MLYFEDHWPAITKVFVRQPFQVVTSGRPFLTGIRILN